MICPHCRRSKNAQHFVQVGALKICHACLTADKPIPLHLNRGAPAERVAEVVAYVGANGEAALAGVVNKTLRAALDAGPLRRAVVERSVTANEAAYVAHWKDKCRAGA